MDKTPQERLIFLFASFSEAAGVFVFTLGCAVLFGWAFSIPILKSILPGLVTMKPNTALCFALLGFSLWMLQAKRAGKTKRLLAQAAVFIIILIAALTALEYFAGVNFGIDEVLFKDDPNPALTVYPGRMALNTAAVFILLSAALLLSGSKKERACYSAQLLAILGFIISMLVGTGYLYGVTFIYNFTTMALHTAAAFLAASLGIFFMLPQRGLASIFTSSNIGGVAVRRLVPVVIVIPSLLGWLKLWSEKSGLVSNEFGVSLVATANMTIISGSIIWLAFFIGRIDSERKRVDEELKKRVKELEIFNKATVDRELKMVELKKRIGELEKKLNK